MHLALLCLRTPAPAVGAADTSQQLQVLCYTRMLLQRLPLRQQAPAVPGPGSVSFESLWELLLLVALKQEHTLVRCASLTASFVQRPVMHAQVPCRSA